MKKYFTSFFYVFIPSYKSNYKSKFIQKIMEYFNHGKVIEMGCGTGLASLYKQRIMIFLLREYHCKKFWIVLFKKNFWLQIQRKSRKIMSLLIVILSCINSFYNSDLLFVLPISQSKEKEYFLANWTAKEVKMIVCPLQ